MVGANSCRGVSKAIRLVVAPHRPPSFRRPASGSAILGDVCVRAVGSFVSCAAFEPNGTSATAELIAKSGGSGRRRTRPHVAVGIARFVAAESTSSGKEKGGTGGVFVSPLIAAQRYAESSYFSNDNNSSMTKRKENKNDSQCNNESISKGPSIFADNPRILKNSKNEPFIPPKKKNQVPNYEINNWEPGMPEGAYKTGGGVEEAELNMEWDSSMFQDFEKMAEFEVESVIARNIRESEQYFAERARMERERKERARKRMETPEPADLGRGPMKYFEVAEAHRKKRLELANYLKELELKQTEKEKGLVKEDNEKRKVLKDPGTRIHPNDVPRLSEKYIHHVHHYERYIKREWLPHFPLGVNLHRLRNDLAYKMKSGNPYRRHKLEMEVVWRIAGEVARRSNLVQLWRTEKGGIVLRPPLPKNQRVGPRRIDPHNLTRVPKYFKPYLPKVEGYIADEWLPNLPDEGLGMNRLWSDLRLFVGGGVRGKERISKEIVKAVIGEFARNGLVEMWKRSGDILLTPPPKNEPREPKTYEEMLAEQSNSSKDGESLDRNENC